MLPCNLSERAKISIYEASVRIAPKRNKILKGLEISELFFNEFGLPAIKKYYPDIVDCISAGLIGGGSEILGADDEFSCDHGWGPTFRLFMKEKDFQEIGKDVEAKLNELKPKIFYGIELSKYHTNPINITTLDQCFCDLTGAPLPPENSREWAFINENGLCFAQSGKIFYDPFDQLRERKQAFEKAYYPDSIWRWRIASRLLRLWHYGDYNIGKRLANRNDKVASLIGQGYFVEASMQLAFLLNRRFAPYWKWLHWAFIQLPYLSNEFEPLLAELESASSLKMKADIIGTICNLYRRVLFDQGFFPDNNWRNFMGAFEILDNIEDIEVKELIKNSEILDEPK